MNKPVGDSRGYGRVVKDVSPVSKRQVCGDNWRAFFMPGADDLEEQIWALCAEGQVSYLVNHQEWGRLIVMEFFQ